MGILINKSITLYNENDAFFRLINKKPASPASETRASFTCKCHAARSYADRRCNGVHLFGTFLFNVFNRKKPFRKPEPLYLLF